jgi:hypothetical protein
VQTRVSLWVAQRLNLEKPKTRASKFSRLEKLKFLSGQPLATLIRLLAPYGSTFIDAKTHLLAHKTAPGGLFALRAASLTGLGRSFLATFLTIKCTWRAWSLLDHKMHLAGMVASPARREKNKTLELHVQNNKTPFSPRGEGSGMRGETRDSAEKGAANSAPTSL